MIISTKELKDACNIILASISSSQAAVTTNELELRVRGTQTELSVASSECNVIVKFYTNQEEEDFHATVNADLFLKLITQITTEDMTLSCEDNYLHIAANGKYKIPLIYNGDEILEVKRIAISNPTVQMSIDSEILNSIYTFNSKELLKGVIKKAVQRYYYLDEFGCITYTSGACINNFSLDKPVKVLLTNKVVKLFKLFKDEPVTFTLGYDPLSENIIQTKVSFETPNVKITTILSCDDAPVNSVPAAAIRNMANTVYPYTVSINRIALLQAINRLLIFNSDNIQDNLGDVGSFRFKGLGEDLLTIKDVRKFNSEDIHCSYVNTEDMDYEALLNLKDLKTTLETMNDPNITLSFGNKASFTIKRDNVTLIIPESIYKSSNNN